MIIDMVNLSPRVYRHLASSWVAPGCGTTHYEVTLYHLIYTYCVIKIQIMTISTKNILTTGITV